MHADDSPLPAGECVPNTSSTRRRRRMPPAQAGRIEPRRPTQGLHFLRGQTPTSEAKGIESAAVGRLAITPNTDFATEIAGRTREQVDGLHRERCGTVEYERWTGKAALPLRTGVPPRGRLEELWDGMSMSWQRARRRGPIRTVIEGLEVLRK
jgi:hypothetical protein